MPRPKIARQTGANDETMYEEDKDEFLDDVEELAIELRYLGCPPDKAERLAYERLKRPARSRTWEEEES